MSEEFIEPEERIEALDIGPLAQEDEVQLNATVPGSDVTAEQLQNDFSNPESWLQYNGNLRQTGDAAVETITPDNVGGLSEEFRISTQSPRLETNPIIVPGGDGNPPVMYFTTNLQTVHAVNARTGDTYWQYTYSPRREGHPGFQNRGVSVMGDTIYYATKDVHLIALDRYNGEIKWETDFMTGEQFATMDPAAARIYHSLAPLVFKGNVFVGQSSDYAGWTVFSVIDGSNGDIINQHRVAPPEQWAGDTWKFSSAAVWMSPTADPESNRVFFATANPDPLFLGTVRPGPNKHANAMIAVDAESGDIDWINQLFAHEIWDYDVGGTTPYVFDAEIDGEQHRLVGIDNKSGWSFFLDVETGELIDRTAAWATQEHKFGRYPAREFLNYPEPGEANKGSLRPVATGATEWPADGMGRTTGYRYIGVNEGAQMVWTDPDWHVKDEPAVAYGGTMRPNPDVPTEGYVKAIDPGTGEAAWETQVDDIDPDASTTAAFLGGVTPTAGNVVFLGSAGGGLYAYDAQTGEQLSRLETGGRISATPVVWDDPGAGKSFVGVASNTDIVVYSLSTN